MIIGDNNINCIIIQIYKENQYNALGGSIFLHIRLEKLDLIKPLKDITESIGVISCITATGYNDCKAIHNQIQLSIKRHNLLINRIKRFLRIKSGYIINKDSIVYKYKRIQIGMLANIIHSINRTFMKSTSGNE